MVMSNQRGLINSLLERSRQSINVDRLLTTDPQTGEPILITDPDEILREASKQYTVLHKKRNHKFDNLPETWVETYESIPEIDSNWFSQLLDEPTQAEWKLALSILLNKSAQAYLELDID